MPVGNPSLRSPCASSALTVAIMLPTSLSMCCRQRQFRQHCATDHICQSRSMGKFCRRVKPEVKRSVDRPHRVEFHLEGHEAGSVEFGAPEYGHLTAEADGCGIRDGVITATQKKRAVTAGNTLDHRPHRWPLGQAKQL